MDIKCVKFLQVAQSGAAHHLSLATVEIPNLSVQIESDLLTVARGDVRLEFVFAAEAFEFGGTAEFEIFERNRGRVSWRTRYSSPSGLTVPINVEANDYGFGDLLKNYDVVVRGRGRGTIANAVLIAKVFHQV